MGDEISRKAVHCKFGTIQSDFGLENKELPDPLERFFDTPFEGDMRGILGLAR